MKVLAVNGSPRKDWNTATLLQKALEGAASQGAKTRLVHLYDLTFKGCRSCFACKKRGGRSYGVCSTQDDLTPIYAEIREAGALVLGSPIYFGDVTGETRSFLERLCFPNLVYEEGASTLFPRQIGTAWIYTMNVPEELLAQVGYGRMFEANERLLRRFFGPCESMTSCDTCQFPDYSEVVAGRFDAARKERRRREVFPKDCQRAFDLGADLAKGPK